jgi:hypothetical protein
MMVLSLSIRLWADILQFLVLLFLGTKLCSLLSVPLLGANFCWRLDVDVVLGDVLDFTPV